MRQRLLLAALAALLLTPAAADAQRRRDRRDRRRVTERVQIHIRDRAPERRLSLVVGALNTDFGDDDNVPMAALRATWRLSRHVRSEVGVSYALGEFDGGATDDINTSLTTATVGVLAELPLGPVRPYTGVTAGLFWRFDEKGGQRFFRPTHAFPVGVRIPITPRLGLQGEVRFRYDADPSGATAANVEQTAGLNVTF